MGLYDLTDTLSFVLCLACTLVLGLNLYSAGAWWVLWECLVCWAHMRSKKVVFTELKAVLEKLSAPCESVASAFQTSFITNNLKFCWTSSVSHIVVVDFWSTLLGKGTSVYWSFAGSHLLRSCHSISVGLNFDEFWLGHGNSLIFIFWCCAWDHYAVAWPGFDF